MTTLTPALLPELITAVTDCINANADEITSLDQVLGDGDHLINLQRGLNALMLQRDTLSLLDWSSAWQKIGMTLMTNMGGASGSLFGTLFIALSKASSNQNLDSAEFAVAFSQAVQAVKQRGKADAGEKTMLDVLIPVAHYLQLATENKTALSETLTTLSQIAIDGMESTRTMLATKGRASFLQERTLGHIDAGAKTSQLMICTVVDVLANTLKK